MAGSGNRKSKAKDPDAVPITPDTDVVDLVAHLDDPELDPREALAQIQERLANWTLARKGVAGTPLLRVKRVSPPELQCDCGDIGIDLHTPFDWSQIPLTFGADGVYYLRVYWGNRRIATLGTMEFPEFRQHRPPIDAAPTIPAVAPQQPIPIQVNGQQQNLLLQLVSAITQQQKESNDAVAAALQANTETMRAFLENKAAPAAGPAGIFEQLDQLSDLADRFQKLQRLFGGGGSKGGDAESPWLELAREAMSEYGEEALTGIFTLLAQRAQQSGQTETEEVQGTVIDLPKEQSKTEGAE